MELLFVTIINHFHVPHIYYSSIIEQWSSLPGNTSDVSKLLRTIYIYKCKFGVCMVARSAHVCYLYNIYSRTGGNKTLQSCLCFCLCFLKMMLD